MTLRCSPDAVRVLGVERRVDEESVEREAARVDRHQVVEGRVEQLDIANRHVRAPHLQCTQAGLTSPGVSGRAHSRTARVVRLKPDLTGDGNAT